MEIKLKRVGSRKKGLFKIDDVLNRRGEFSEAYVVKKGRIINHSDSIFKKKGAYIGKYNHNTREWNTKTEYHINQFSDDVREKMAVLELVAASSEAYWIELPEVGSTTKEHSWYRIVLKGGSDE